MIDVYKTYLNLRAPIKLHALYVFHEHVQLVAYEQT